MERKGTEGNKNTTVNSKEGSKSDTLQTAAHRDIKDRIQREYISQIHIRSWIKCMLKRRVGGKGSS